MQIHALGRGQLACSGKGQGVNDSGSAGREVSVTLLSSAARRTSSQAGMGATGGLCARGTTSANHWHRRTARPERRVRDADLEPRSPSIGGSRDPSGQKVFSLKTSVS